MPALAGGSVRNTTGKTSDDRRVFADRVDSSVEKGERTRMNSKGGRKASGGDSHGHVWKSMGAPYPSYVTVRSLGVS